MTRFPLPLIIACGCAIALLGFGPRSAFGLFQADLAQMRPWGREAFSLAFAIQNLMWGIGQPLCGAIADRYGSWRVLAVGGLLYALGTAGIVYFTSEAALYLLFGVTVGLGMSAASFTIVLSAFGRSVTPAKRSLAFGIGTASGSLGMFVFGPLGAVLLSRFGVMDTMLFFAALLLLIIVLAIPLQGRSTADPNAPSETLGQAISGALRHRSYVLLVFGFFVCGFHVAFIIAHMPAFLGDLGLPATLAGTALGLIGLFNVFGALGAGWIGSYGKRAYSLSALYLARSIAIAAFILLPITPVSVLVFASVMGLLWLSTVPLTSGLVATMFGPRYMATLFGLVFLSHQIGSFLGVWLGGVIYDRTGSYDGLWWLGVALGVFAAVVHLPIKDAPAPQMRAATA